MQTMLLLLPPQPCCCVAAAAAVAAAAMLIHACFLLALALSPPISRYALADLGWAARKVAGALFGKPPDATFAEALIFFERAESIDPGFWKKNQAMIGACLVKVESGSRKTEAAKWLRSALAIESVTTEDKEAHEEASKLLKKLKL